MTRELICLLIVSAMGLAGCRGEITANRQIDGAEKTPSVVRMPRLKRPIECAAFYGPGHAWIGTEEGDLLRTQDQGITWDKTPAGSVGGFERLSFINPDRGWTINDRGQVWSTQDGGRTWTLIGRLAEGRFFSIDQIKFEDEDAGWLMEVFSIWRTTDGGASWAQTEFETPLATAWFANDREAWVFDQANGFCRTRDGGYDWEIKYTVPVDGDIRSIFCITGSKGWLARGRNRLYKTEDGGASWQIQTVPGNKTDISSLYFRDDADGWAAGSESRGGSAGNEKFKGILMHTLDGGQTWEIQRIGVQDYGYEAVYFADAFNGWLRGFDKVYRTEDGGKQWRVVLNLERATY